jgi:hypothetical protein
MSVDLKNIFGRLSGAFNKRSLKFATEVEHEALKLIRGKVSPYDAISRGRQLVSARRHPGGEQPALRDFTLIQKMLSNYDPSIVDRHISPNDTMRGDYYFVVGTSAIEAVVTACDRSEQSS